MTDRQQAIRAELLEELARTVDDRWRWAFLLQAADGELKVFSNQPGRLVASMCRAYIQGSRLSRDEAPEK